MFIRTLPETIRREIYRRPEVEAHDLLRRMDGVRHQTLYVRTEELAAHHLKPERAAAVSEHIPGQHAAALRPGGPPRKTKAGGDRRQQLRPPRQIRPALDPLAKQFEG